MPAATVRTPYLYSGYVSYLAPVRATAFRSTSAGSGTVLGAEVVQTNGNCNVTQGAVFGLQPVTYNGVSARRTSDHGRDQQSWPVSSTTSTATPTVSADNDKAYFGQVSYGPVTRFGLERGRHYRRQ